MALKWPQWRLTQQRGENSLFSGIGATDLYQSPLPFLVHACNNGPWMVFLGRYLSNWENVSINTIKPDWRAKNLCANFRLSHFRPCGFGQVCKPHFIWDWKRLWCQEGLGAGGEGDDRGWDGWMASLTRWTWVWVNSGSWWWTGRPGVLQFMGSQRAGHDWATELNWTDSHIPRNSEIRHRRSGLSFWDANLLISLSSLRAI